MRKIKYKQYKLYKLLIVILLAIAIGLLVSAGNFILPLIIFIVAILFEFLLRGKVDTPLTDERLNNIGGKASRAVFVTFALLMAAAGIVLISLRDLSPYCLIIGNMLLGIECSMMLLYAILFKYYSKKKL
jgi:uncharacterized membrane protein